VGARLFARIAGRFGEGERVGMPAARLVGLTGGAQGLAEAIERLGFPAAIADLAKGREPLLEVGSRLPEAAEPPQGDAAVGQCMGFAGPAADFPAQADSLLLAVGGVLVSPIRS